MQTLAGNTDTYNNGGKENETVKVKLCINIWTKSGIHILLNYTINHQNTHYFDDFWSTKIEDNNVLFDLI